MIRLRTGTTRERLQREDSRPVHRYTLPSFDAELRAAREELVQRSQQPDSAPSTPADESGCENSMIWLDARTRLNNAASTQLRALTVAENEEWAEDCGNGPPAPRKPRAPRLIDY